MMKESSKLGRDRYWLVPVAVLGMGLAGCVARPVEKYEGRSGSAPKQVFPQSLDKDVDILFLIDDSPSMGSEQATLKAQFYRLIDALRSDKLGSDGSGKPCTPTDTSGCAIPNVHIGVVTPNLGAGPAGEVITGCKVIGGLGGKLQNTPREAGCIPPNDPWISYEEGTTNVPSGSSDAVTRIKDAFACIARVGDEGCGFEQQLEATRMALDPTLNVNPGFLRANALLAVVYITDEDDCSAKDVGFYDPTVSTLGTPRYRCFQYGVTCSEGPSDPRAAGTRDGCVPASDLMRPVLGGGDSYETFFKALKPQGRVIMAAIAGPPTPVNVSITLLSPDFPEQGDGPELQPSCPAGATAADVQDPSYTGEGAFPAIRIKALLDSFTEAGGDTPGQFTGICGADFGSALAQLGKKIVGALGKQCATSPMLTAKGALACAPGEDLGGGMVCPAAGCLDQVDCSITETFYGSDSQGSVTSTVIQRCPSDIFNNTSTQDCGATCPCWRFEHSSSCDPATDGTPYSLNILRKDQAEPPPGTFAEAQCRVATGAWGSAELKASIDIDGDGQPNICE